MFQSLTDTKTKVIPQQSLYLCPCMYMSLYIYIYDGGEDT